jgi:hypothetical protein
MVWTAATFKARWAEFTPTPDATVTAVLAEAATYCDERLFGDRYDQAVGLYAAHLLSIAPFGQQARADGKGPPGTDTTYLQQWTRLARAVAGGPWTMGRGYDGAGL